VAEMKQKLHIERLPKNERPKHNFDVRLMREPRVAGKSHSIYRRVAQSKREVFYTGEKNKYLQARRSFIDKDGIERKYNEDALHEKTVQLLINKEWKFKHLQFPFVNGEQK
jgi:hypothetical protein